MTISVKHKFQSAKADGPDSSVVRPSNWNDEHNFLIDQGLFGRSAAGNGAPEILVPDTSYFTMSSGAITLKSSWVQALAPKDNATFTNTTTFAKAAVDGAAGTSRPYQWKTATSLRWELRANTTAEGGANAGSNFVLTRYADNGTAIDDALTVTRSTGVFNFQYRPQYAGSNLALVSEIPAIPSYGPQLGTAVPTTSGTSIDLTGIPSTAKRVTVMMNGVSMAAAGIPTMQLGTSGGVETTGYADNYVIFSSGASNSTSTTGLQFTSSSAATYGINAMVTIVSMGSNIWLMAGIGNYANTGNWFAIAVKTLSGTLDRVRLTSTAGTDTFDAGSINIMWE